MRRPKLRVLAATPLHRCVRQGMVGGFLTTPSAEQRELAKFMPVRWTGRKAGWSVTRRNVGSEIQNSRLARSAHYDRKTAPEAKQRHAGKAHGDVPVDESMCKSPMSLSC